MMFVSGLGAIFPTSIVANSASMIPLNPQDGTGSSQFIDCTNPANANNPICVSIGAFPATQTETGVVATDCTNPVNATNPACAPAAAWDGTILGIPWYLWLGVGIGAIWFFKRKKQKPATS